jgi:multidrug efflux pump subunit AcrA (membrane-fusion protein)
MYKKSIPLFGALLLIACHKEEKKESEPIAPVQVAAVEQATIHKVVEADAVLYPIDQANIMPKITAPVAKFFVKRGDHIKANQVVATLENRDLIASAAAAKAQIDQANANLRSTADATIPESVTKAQTDVQSAQQQLIAAERLLKSRQELFKQGALAGKQVDEAQVSYAQAKAQSDSSQEHLRALQSVGKQAQVETARAQVQTAEAQYKAADAQVVYSEVRTPIGGIVADRPLYPGDLASQGIPLATVVDISRIVARANVPQNQATEVKVGDPATIKLTDGSFEVPGKVTVVSPATDPASTTVQVWVEANNPSEKLKPGASVHVTIMVATIKDAVVVPASAILPGEEGGTAVATVSASNTAHLKKVEIGVREGDKVQILTGASPGDQVIVVGGVGLDDKAKVRIVQPGEKDEEPAADEAGGKDDKKGK